jgi:ferredoxin
MDAPRKVLGVGSRAGDDEIEQAYRERVKEAHPDQGGSIEEFRAVRTAYEQLKADDGHLDDERATAAEDDPDPEPAISRVTYLNYDVLADFGWGVDDTDLFSKAASADLEDTDYGEFVVDPGETLLEAAENSGYAWPFACRGGACANCAILIHEGELSMPVSHVLTTELMERNVRLSCNGIPITDELHVVYNAKHMPDLEELLLPPRPFKQAYSD